MSIRNLEALFHPRSIAVIGASDRPGSLGNLVLANVKAGGFTGPVWPVNVRHRLVGGAKAWPDVASLPEVPDLAVICTPPASVAQLIAALGERGTRAAIVMAAGLKLGPEDGGPSFEQQMLAAAKPWLLRILGPNCLGVLVPGAGLNASFAPGNAMPGDIAFVTQSGALATAMLDWANGRGIGFSHFVSMGDIADVDFGDMLDYLGSDPKTRSILLYMESVTSARKFMSAARGAARNKPVIVVKSGRALEGARAAASHTGALAGSEAVFDAAVRRAGMLRVDTLEDLFDAAETLAHTHPWRGDRLAVLTNGGGAGVLAADALALGGGRLAVLCKETQAALDACLPATWSHGNPVDMIGDAPVARYTDALRILLAAPEVDGVLFIHAPTAVVSASDIASACLALAAPAGKPVLSCWLGGRSVEAAREFFRMAGLPCYTSPERAVGAWLHLAQYARNRVALFEMPGAKPEYFKPDREAALAVMEQAGNNGQQWLDPVQAQEVLRAYGLPVIPVQIGHDAEQAAAIARHTGFPVALKIVSSHVIHKSDVHGVVTGLASSDAVHDAAVQMRVDMSTLAPLAPVTGFAVQAMASRPGAIELIIGIASDPVFGPVLLFGKGGTDVELDKHHVIGLPPLNTGLARGLIGQSGLARRLAGYRGSKPVDLNPLEDALVKVSQMACDLPTLAELDINPLLADENGVLAIDARIRLHPRGTLVLPPSIRPYPAELAEKVQLDGHTLLLRPIRPEDEPLLSAFYEHSSASDMRLRFFTLRREVPHSELARFTQIDYDREMAFIALLTLADGSREMVADVRAICDPDNRRAEFAVQVAAAWQDKGLGALMMQKILHYLRGRGTAEIFGECLQENYGMAHLARQAGLEVVRPVAGDTVSLRLSLSPEQAN